MEMTTTAAYLYLMKVSFVGCLRLRLEGLTTLQPPKEFYNQFPRLQTTVPVATSEDLSVRILLPPLNATLHVDSDIMFGPDSGVKVCRR